MSGVRVFGVVVVGGTGRALCGVPFGVALVVRGVLGDGCVAGGADFGVPGGSCVVFDGWEVPGAWVFAGWGLPVPFGPGWAGGCGCPLPFGSCTTGDACPKVGFGPWGFACCTTGADSLFVPGPWVVGPCCCVVGNCWPLFGGGVSAPLEFGSCVT
jgi:hypothetical protein